jgi:hypothetical protein
MNTREQYEQECRAANPEMIQTVNGVSRKLTEAEYEEAVTAWALMRWYQDNPDQQPEATAL